VETLQGRFTYAVEWSKITKPDAMWVLDDTYDDDDDPDTLQNTLTLTACHPRMDLTERYIIRAVLQGEPVPRLPGQDESMAEFDQTSDSLADGITAASHPEAWPPTVLFGVLGGLVWFVTWWA